MAESTKTKTFQHGEKKITFAFNPFMPISTLFVQISEQTILLNAGETKELIAWLTEISENPYGLANEESEE